MKNEFRQNKSRQNIVNISADEALLCPPSALMNVFAAYCTCMIMNVQL